MPERALPGWPRLMDRRLAAAYCGVSINHFLLHVPVDPVILGTKKLWDRRQIDRWLDRDEGMVERELSFR